MTMLFLKQPAGELNTSHKDWQPEVEVAVRLETGFSAFWTLCFPVWAAGSRSSSASPGAHSPTVLRIKGSQILLLARPWGMDLQGHGGHLG